MSSGLYQAYWLNLMDPWYTSIWEQTHCSAKQGAIVKRELGTMSIALDLPKDIAQYKKRFEDYSDECICCT